MATIKDIAREAGVSVSTVSFVLNSTLENTRTSPETWKKVRRVMEELHYQPSNTARKLRKSAADQRNVCLLWPLEYNYTAIGEFLVLLQDTFDEAGFDCGITVHTFREGKLEGVFRKMEEEWMDGAIVALPDTRDMEWLEGHAPKLPTVLLGRQLHEYSFVRADNRLAGRLAAQPLQDWRGADVAFFHYDRAPLDVRKQIEDFQLSCKEFGVKLRGYSVRRSPRDRYILEGTQKLLQDALPQAVVYFSGDRTVYTSIYALMDEGIQIPSDLKVIQVNMLFGQMAQLARPYLTRVRCDTAAMVAQCAQTLYEQITGKNRELQQLIFEPSLFYGETFPKNKF